MPRFYQPFLKILAIGRDGGAYHQSQAYCPQCQKNFNAAVDTAIIVCPKCQAAIIHCPHDLDCNANGQELVVENCCHA